MLILIRDRPSSKKSILTSVQVTTTPELESLTVYSSGSKHVCLQITMCNVICQLQCKTSWLF